MERSKVFETLAKMGVALVEVQFSGGGDSGGVNSITLHKEDGTTDTLEEWYPSQHWENGKWVETEKPTELQELSSELSKPVYDKYYTFAGEFNVNGSVIWNVKNKTVIMEGSESVETYEDFSEEF